eukprot:m.153951 g.153951  ORF g.153951 m.153951 type:complete len:1210 (-) comp16246_c6_seq1:118-3747(-)
MLSSADTASAEPSSSLLFNFSVRDETTGKRVRSSASLTSTHADFYGLVARLCSYEPDTFDLVFEAEDGTEATVDSSCTYTMSDLHLRDKAENRFLVREAASGPPVAAKKRRPGENFGDVPALGSTDTKLQRVDSSSDEDSSSLPQGSTLANKAPRFVGLANQGATCYLNSLLQSLYMTPEFRNAIYRWTPEATEENSIPAELQKLFLRLQTSRHRAVETKDITKSFGWEGNEAFQQHDVQELMRVLFDALEEEWQDTPLKTAIKDLYEGEIHDYVCCTECNYESARTDKFMDVPLVIKPFGSSTVMRNVDEAMHKFVEVEKMEGDNQYECARCKKKVDALKGLKFTAFPYILTLQLKRFDFDYTTLRRIKLNSRFEFPLEMDVSEFLSKSKNNNESNNTSADAAAVNQDSASQHQSPCTLTEAPNGSLTKREPFMDSSVGPSNPGEQNDTLHNDPPPTYEESIAQSQPQPKISFDELARQKQAKREEAMKQGCVYELFSIMIHRGSALGGHYYAYIKSLDDGRWHCFNDSSVTLISERDISDAFGGQQATYGWSSTSGYMLMYRRIDPSKNERFPTVDELPEHLKDMMSNLEEEETKEREEQLKAERAIRFHVYNHVGDKKLITIDRTETVSALYELALKNYEIDEKDRTKYRLCRYDVHRKRFLDALTDSDKRLETLGYMNTWSIFGVGLQQANADGEFEEFDPLSMLLTVRVFDQEKKEFGLAFAIKVPLQGTYDDLVEGILQKFESGDRNTISLIKAEHTIRVLKPGTLTQTNFIYGGETIYATFEPFDETNMLTSDTGKELDRKRNEILINVHLTDSIIPGGATHPLRVDRRMSLQDLKEKHIEPLTNGLTSAEFLIFRKRVYSGTEHVTELTRLQDSLDSSYLDTSPEVEVRRGKALKPGEVKTTIHIMDTEEEESPELLEDFPVLSKGAISQVLVDIATAVHQKKQEDPDWKYKDVCEDTSLYRLWETTAYISPLRVLREGATLPVLYSGKSFLLQILDAPEPELTSHHKVLFGRRFKSSTLEMGPLEEFLIDVQEEVDGLKQTVAEASGIASENLEFVPASHFPFKMDPFHSRDLKWFSPASLRQIYCITDGSGFLYHDKTEEIRELTEEEEEKLKRKRAQEKSKGWRHKEVGVVIKRKTRQTPSTSSASKAETPEGEDSDTKEPVREDSSESTQGDATNSNSHDVQEDQDADVFHDSESQQ